MATIYVIEPGLVWLGTEEDYKKYNKT